MTLSIRTNPELFAALQSFSGAGKNQNIAQNRVSTGLKVQGAVDDASSFAIAQGIRTTSKALESIDQGVNRALGILQVATAGSNAIGELLQLLKEKATQARNLGLTSEQRELINRDFRDLVNQIDNIVDSAEFQGVNLLRGEAFDIDSSTFSSESIYQSRGASYNMDTGDINNDGVLDLLVGTSGALGNLSITVFSGNTDGTFVREPYVQGTPPDGGVQQMYTDPEFGDFNQDGNLDIAAVVDAPISVGGNSELHIFSGNGDGTFSSPLISTISIVDRQNISVGDVNQDGLSDITVTAQNGQIQALLSNGDLTFSNQTPQALGGPGTRNQIMADLDGDGRLDIAFGAQSGNISVALGNGDGTFNLSSTTNTGLLNVTGPAVGDINGDGVADIVVGSSTSNQIATLLGNGDGTFTTSTVLNGSGENFGESIQIADMNNDGAADIISSGGTTNQFSVFQGDGSGGFLPSADISSNMPYALVVDDFNGDGLQDIATANFIDQDVSVYLNNGSSGTLSGGQELNVLISERGDTFTIRHQPMTSQDLGISSTDVLIDPSEAISKIDRAIDLYANKTARLGRFHEVLIGVNKFNGERSDSINLGLGNIVDADIAKENARLLASQVRTELSSQTLAITQKLPENLLRLFNI